MFEIDNSIISSEELIAKVRRKALDKNIPMSLSDESETDTLNTSIIQLRNELTKLSDSVNELNTLWIITEPVVYSNRKGIGPVIVFVKKVIRKCSRWLFRPYFDQVIQFNGAVTRAVSDTLRIQQRIIDQIQRMTEEQNSL